MGPRDVHLVGECGLGLGTGRAGLGGEVKDLIGRALPYRSSDGLGVGEVALEHPR